jgi:hypothetical protein
MLGVAVPGGYRPPSSASELLKGGPVRAISLVLVVCSACSATVGANGSGGDDTSPGPDGGAAADAGTASDGGSTIDAPPAPTITVLRGVDRAGAFSMTEATTLKSADAVTWTGVYIGGPCNAGSGWTKALVASFASQLGWTFMPIYVGRQASSICSASTLTAAQGTADGQAAAADMATFGWQPNRNIPVCLDLEAGTYSSSASGSLAYAKAWRDAVRSAGYLAYIYSNPTGINGLYDAGAPFDGAWPASWFYTSFENVAPSDLSQLGTRYNSTNRAWQYASFTSSVGGIDADTSDLLLAPAPDGTNL